MKLDPRLRARCSLRVVAERTSSLQKFQSIVVDLVLLVVVNLLRHYFDIISRELYVR